MNQANRLWIACGAVLGSGFALYKEANQVAAGLALVGWVALVSIEPHSKKRGPVQKKICRSRSAPDLQTVVGSSPLCSVPLLSPQQTWQPVVAASTRSPTPTIKLSSLPRQESSLLGDLGASLYRVVFGPGAPRPPYPPEIVDGVVDLRGGVRSPWPFDLEERFGSSPPSLELGAVEGKGGAGWIILVDELTRAQEIRSTQPEALVVVGRYLSLYLPRRSLKRIDLRLIDGLAWGRELQNLRLFSPELKEGGEFRCIFNTNERQFAGLWLGGMRGKEANRFDSPREEIEGDELHFIYRRKERGS